MVIDVTKCNGCFNCQIACKDEFVENDCPSYSASQPETGHFWMFVQELERGTFPKVKLAYLPQPCMQCDKPPCVDAAIDKAVYKRNDGITIIDPQKSVGQRQVVSSCPYGKIFWNTNSNIPQKCTFCAHLLDRGWKEPRCVEVCPVGALLFGNVNNPQTEVSKLIRSGKAQQLHPEFGTSPKVYYIGLPKKFIAGSVVCEISDECLERASITLKDLSTGRSYATKTNNYGDFEFAGLETNKTYTITIEAKGYHPKVLGPIALKQDEYLGEIFIRKS